MKATFIISGIIIFIIFFIPVFERILNLGNFSGMALGIASLVSGIYLNKMSFSAEKWCVFIFIIAMLFCLIGCFLIYREGASTAKDEEVVIVLGCKVKGDRPSLALQKRIDSAYNFLLLNPQSVAILSGGQGKDEGLSEALCMKKQLCDRGIAESRLLIEDKSTSTDENIRFSMELLKKHCLPNKVAIATSEYHQRRAGMICRRYGLEASALSSRTRIDLLPTFLLREVLGVIKEKILK